MSESLNIIFFRLEKSIEAWWSVSHCKLCILGIVILLTPASETIGMVLSHYHIGYHWDGIVMVLGDM